MSSVNDNTLSQTATATSTAAATANADAQSGTQGAKVQNPKRERAPRGKQQRDHKKDAKKCDYCNKLGHTSDSCYKKSTDERVNEAVDISIRVARAMAPVSPVLIPAAQAAPAASAAIAAQAAQGDDDDSDSESGWGDASEDPLEVFGIGAGDDDMMDVPDEPIVPEPLSFSDSVIDSMVATHEAFVWLLFSMVRLVGYLAFFFVSCASKLFRARVTFADGRLKTLAYGDEDPFMQVVRGVDYMMRVLFYLIVVPYVLYCGYSYYVIARGTDYVVTEAVLMYCDKPAPAVQEVVSPDLDGINAMQVGLKSAAGLIDAVTQGGYGVLFGGSTLYEEAKAIVEEPWHKAQRDVRISRLYKPNHEDYCGHLPVLILTYARALIYGMLGLMVLVYLGLLWYNFPVHNRPDYVRYTYVADHDEYNRVASLGDTRGAAFRSVKADSPDFIKDPGYMIYHVDQVQNNVRTQRYVVVSRAIFQILNSPTNTIRWVDEADIDKYRKDTAAFAKASLQCVNNSEYVEAKEDCIFQTSLLFAWHMRAKRDYPLNFRAPKVE